MFAASAAAFTDNVQAIPSSEASPLEALAQAEQGDVLLAMTFEPYRSDALEAVRCAKRKGLRVLVLTDSWKSPAAADADDVFTMPAAAPHIFASVVPAMTFLEILLAFLIKEGGTNTAARIRKFHRNRFDLGMYWSGDETR